MMYDHKTTFIKKLKFMIMILIYLSGTYVIGVVDFYAVALCKRETDALSLLI